MDRGIEEYPTGRARVNFNEHSIREGTYGTTRGRGSSSSYATGDNRPRAQLISEEVLLATDKHQTNDRGETQMRQRNVNRQADVMPIKVKEEVNTAPRRSQSSVLQ